MAIELIKEENISEAAKILRDYWKDRGMEYPQRWAESYLRKGHAKEIKQDMTFVLRERNIIIGIIAMVVYEGNVAEIRDLVTRKEFRGIGHGRAMLEFVLDYCAKSNIRKVYALTFPQHQQLFEEHSFVKEGCLRSHFKDKEDLMIMSLFFQQKEKQEDLKEKLENISEVQDIESETAQRLRRLKSR